MKSIITFIKPYIHRTNLIFIIISLLLSFFSIICSISIPFLFKNVINNLIYDKNMHIKLLLLIISILIIQLFSTVISDYLIQAQGIDIVLRIRKKLISKISNLNKSFFDKNKSGNISSILSNDSNSIYILVIDTLPNLITSFINAILLIVSLFYLSYKLTLVLVFVIPLILSIYKPLGKKLGSISNSMQKSTGLLNDFGFFITENNNLIKSHSSQNFEKRRGNIIINNLKEISLKRTKIVSIISPLLNVLSLLTVIGSVIYGFYLASIKEITIGGLVAYITLFFQVMTPISSFGESLSEIESMNGSSMRMKSILTNDNLEEILIGKNIDSINKISFNNVSFKYDTKKEDSLKNVSFRLKKGEKVALIGPSGSGKTTIVSLIERFYLHYKGVIKFNDIDANSISIKSIRDSISYVSQKNNIIDGTIRDNILYANKKNSDNEILKISHDTGFIDVIEDLPNGLDTYIGKGGIILSEGQLQRLVITRELLGNKSLIIFDEAESSLDIKNEKNLNDLINQISYNKIVLNVTHRLSTIKSMDKIIFIENGVVTGVGSHYELLKSHKMYSEFIRLKFSDEKGDVHFD